MTKLTDEEFLTHLLRLARQNKAFFPREVISIASTDLPQYLQFLEQFKRCKHPLMKTLLAECRLNLLKAGLDKEKSGADPRVLDDAKLFLDSDLLEETAYSANSLTLFIEKE